MYYSKKYQFLFIASPKTGSTSVEQYLRKVDPDGEKSSITLIERKITSNHMFYGVLGHGRAWEFKQALGEEEFNKLSVFGFIRNPYDKLISSYFYNKNQSLTEAFTIKGKKKLHQRMIYGLLTRLAPRILPIQIWSIFFPMKSNYEYFHDNKGNRIAKYIGRTEKLENDLNLILKKIGIQNGSTIPHINRSQHKQTDDYFKNKFLRKILEKRYEKDFQLYRQVQIEMTLLLEK